ncbi:hypothetical protein DQ04_11411010 [Trypanosoma grayi]|uniref:hypothetical protein n=1 Tax=Trypanosoma grayi TaxID=71804 RepID=UPI0004F4A21E|nr:hypothetical protein DQ04_11411010 [Trypanosoma grayi]KEG06976.1 hypothetical protein DQ04_11411010 [Trypanosoma grayi]
MRGGEQCAFRYYEVLPLDLEPDYKLGYTCDMCSKDFSKAPFFHCARSGRDLCMSCGEKMGLSPYSALINRVMIPDLVWRDAQKETVVVLCYQIHFETLGCHFSDGSNLLIPQRDDLPSYFIDSGSSFENSTLLAKNDLQRRFPWIKEALKKINLDGVSFHPMSTSSDRSRSCFLKSFRQDGVFIEFRLSDGFCEVLHCSEGVDLVIKDALIVSCLVLNSPVRWGKVLPKAASVALEWFLKNQ